MDRTHGGLATWPFASLQARLWRAGLLDDVIENCREEPLGTRNNKACVAGAGVASLSSMARLLCPFRNWGLSSVGASRR